MTDEDIHDAVERADLDALRRELAKGVSPNTLNQYGETPLHYLCDSNDDAEGRLACLHVLLEAGADVNAPHGLQSTPLLYAAHKRKANVVAALLEAGADVNRGDANGDTPLHWACMHGDGDAERVVILLIRNGAAVNVRNRVGGTPLDWAQEFSRRLVPILLRAGAALPAQTDDAYLRKVIAAGGFRQYECNHLNALTATFAPKFAHLPPEMVRRVVEYAFHVGDY